ncbi:MAG: hypothetical protein ACFFAH_03215 [Promethearchaeota archaeon]
MNKKNWREWALIFSIIGIIQFFLLTLIAMLFYAGGTLINPNAPGYSFWTNWFSDLGRTKAYSGKDNTVSYIIFTITLSVLGISLITFAIAFPYFFKENSLEKWLSIIGSISLVIRGILVVGIALTPWDIYFYEHVTFDRISGWFSLIGWIFIAIVLYHNKEFPDRIAYILIISIVVGTTISVTTNLFGVWPPTNTEELMLFTAGQKIRIYFTNVCGLYIYYGIWKQIKS